MDVIFLSKSPNSKVNHLNYAFNQKKNDFSLKSISQVVISFLITFHEAFTFFLPFSGKPLNFHFRKKKFSPQRKINLKHIE